MIGLLKKRQAQPLVKKLENVLPYLIKLITNTDFKQLRDKFPIPKKDLITGLYEINYDNPFYKDYIIKPGQRAQRRGKTRKDTRFKTRRKENKVNESIPGDDNENKEKNEEVKQNTINDDNNNNNNNINKENQNEIKVENDINQKDN